MNPNFEPQENDFFATPEAARIQKMNRTSDISCYKNHYDGTTKVVNGNVVWTGLVALAGEKAFNKPLHTKKPTKFFVNSMGDLFHENVPEDWIEEVFAIIALCPQHIFQILIKHPKRIRNSFRAWAGDIEIVTDNHGREGILRHPMPNVWLGVSVENQETANERIPILLDTPAAVRFISAEPLLGAIDLTNIEHKPNEFYSALYDPDDLPEDSPVYLDWVIVGGESGKNARPMHPDWVRSLRDQCAQSDNPFFFKQWGKKLAGNMLDGVQHHELPKIGGAA